MKYDIQKVNKTIRECIPDKILPVLGKLRKAGYEAYIVGGCVRDIVLGRTPNDFDVCTSAFPEETEAVFADMRVIETGIQHGTVTVLVEGEPVEITTFRVDGGYTDGRHPDSVSFTRTIGEDLARRDFTVNAMAWSEQTGIVDFYGGMDDCEKKVIRCVGEPEERFSEDALRILRALRFASVLGFEIDEPTADAARLLRAKLKLVSGERLRVELEKLLLGEKAGEILLDYPDVLGTIIPELAVQEGYDQRNYHHRFDLLEHTAYTVGAVPEEIILRMAALLHDIGKPETCTVDEQGTAHYWGHEEKGAVLADRILRELRYDNRSREKIVKLIRHHWTDIQPDLRSVRETMRDLGKDFYRDLVVFMRADNASKMEEFVVPEFYDEIERIGREVLEQNLCCSVKELDITGDDLVQIGFKRGKEIGIALEKILDEVIGGNAENRKESLLQIARSFLE